MLLSHHAPCDFDRTWSIGGIRVCVRCLAVFVFAVLGFLAAFHFSDPLSLGSLTAGLSVFPAWVDFAVGELWKGYPRTNFFRFSTGMIFGCGLGVSLGWVVFAGRWWPFLTFFVLTVFCELMIAFAFYFSGHLQSYLSKYECAVNNS